MEFKSGLIAIVGRPNVGKSSIMNKLVGEKVAIVSPKPQTTRARIMGVATRESFQLVFVDTPGLHKPRTKLGEFMEREARDAREGVDAVLCVFDATAVGPGDRAVAADIARMQCKKALALNKIDLIGPDKLLPLLESLRDAGFDDIVPVSAARGDGMDELMALLAGYMPVGPKYFPDDMMTDQPERIMCAELIREKALKYLRDEVPHGIGVELLSFEREGEGPITIHANVYCEKASHKPVIIGKQGAMLKRIGTEARLDMERLLGARVDLRLWVKVREGWRDRASDLRDQGYTTE